MPRSILVVLAVGLAACSSGDGGPAVAPSTTETETTVLVPSTTAPAVTTSTTPPGLTAQSRLRMDGIGPIRIGMTADEASSVASVRIRVGDDQFGNCRYAWTPEIAGVSFMVLDGRSARVSIDARSPTPIRTVSGVAIGATEDEVHRVYGSRIEVERHLYNPAGHYLIYTAADPSLSGYSLLFETDGRMVTTFRSGLKGAVAAPEGCA